MAITEKNTGRESDKFMLRLPEGMRDKIAEAAKANGRSMNSEIIARLSSAEAMSPLQALDAIVLLTQDRARTELQVKGLYLELLILADHFSECLSKFPSDAVKPGSALEKELDEWRRLSQEAIDMAKPHAQTDDVFEAVKSFQEITEKARKRVPAAYPPGPLKDYVAEMQSIADRNSKSKPVAKPAPKEQSQRRRILRDK